MAIIFCDQVPCEKHENQHSKITTKLYLKNSDKFSRKIQHGSPVWWQAQGSIIDSAIIF